MGSGCLQRRAPSHARIFSLVADEGAINAARKLYLDHLPVIEFVGGQAYVAGTKALLSHMGFSAGVPRPPRLPLPAPQTQSRGTGGEVRSGLAGGDGFIKAVRRLKERAQHDRIRFPWSYISAALTVMSDLMKKPDLRGVTVATVLPFKDDLSIDWDGYARLLDYCACPDGIAAVFVNGMRRGGSLSDEERQAVIARTRAHIGGKPLLAGIIAHSTAEAIRQARLAEAAGAACAVLFPPAAIAVVHRPRRARRSPSCGG